MRRHLSPILALSLLSFVGSVSCDRDSTSTVSVFPMEDTLSEEGNPRLMFSPDWDSEGLKGERLARAFVDAHRDTFRVDSKDDFELIRTRQSLLGTHYTFAQTIDAVAVENAEVNISVDKTGRRIYMVYNTAVPVLKVARPSRARAVVTDDQALRLAWDHLHVQGSLMDAPRVSTRWARVDSRLVLVKKIVHFVSSPRGAWEVTINAMTGDVLSRVDTIVYKRAPEAIDWKKVSRAPSRDLDAALAEYYTRQNAERLTAREEEFAADGLALVFDPDPRSSTNQLDLVDNSPAAKFDAAYLERPLRDLTKSGDKFLLKGPYIEIADFESPTAAPVTSATGKFEAKRGNNGFNDVMTYFHVDQNQRYLQSLGFTGEMAIQDKPIKTDSNGVNGDDNSHYIPGSNAMAFGHGCVDDNEDADVILHEYGHALTHDITPSWGGADSGAIGEGFGDYWGATYGYSFDSVKDFEPFHAFHWDGVSGCWPGRRLDAFAAQYDPTKTYGAHAQIPGGFQSDELWGTPIVQALWTLLEQGVAREEVDKIIIQSFFGLGSGVKMPEMAGATVNAAKMLFPQGPHARVFIEKFVAHNILQTPMPKFDATAVSVLDAGANNAADPGEKFSLKVSLRNIGTADATHVKARLVSNDDTVSIEQDTVEFGDMATVNTSAPATEAPEAFVVRVASNHPCGAFIHLSLIISNGESSDVTIPINLPTGTPMGAIELSATPNKSIPDNNAAGLTSVIDVETAGAAVGEDFAVSVEIKHPYIGDLEITLVSPAGTRVRLKTTLSGGAADDISGTYPATLTPAEPLSALVGESVQGEWKLIVADRSSSDTGTFKSWSLKNNGPSQCE